MEMKKTSRWLQLSAAQGPKECGWVVAQLLPVLIADAKAAIINIEVVEVLAYDKHLRKQCVITPDAYRSALLRIDAPSTATVDAFVASWSGVIQWCGISMYRAKHKRRNWFVNIHAIENTVFDAVDINTLKCDIEISSMRSSGPGGQHVNTTNSAVRVTHRPSGLQVRVDTDRSQHRNKQLAIERLVLLLHEQNQAQIQQHSKNRWQSHQSITRGNAVRVFAGSLFEAVT